MLSIYPACFFKEDNGYSVVFPDLNWLATCGDSLLAKIKANGPFNIAILARLISSSKLHVTPSQNSWQSQVST